MLENIYNLSLFEFKNHRSNITSSIFILIFYALGIIIFSFAMGGNVYESINKKNDILNMAQMNAININIGIIWGITIFALLFYSLSLFKEDISDGTLEQLIINDMGLTSYVVIKTLISWAFNCLPFIILQPLFTTILNIPPSYWLNIMLSLVIGSLALSFTLSLCVSFIVNHSKNNFILSILFIPLSIPILIFAISSSENNSYSLLILLAFSIISIFIYPIITGYILKQLTNQ